MLRAYKIVMPNSAIYDEVEDMIKYYIKKYDFEVFDYKKKSTNTYYAILSDNIINDFVDIFENLENSKVDKIDFHLML